MGDFSNLEFKLFKKYISDKCGIDISEEKAYLIETRLSKLLVDSGMKSFEELYRVIQYSTEPNIATKVINAITTNETLWFRDSTPWNILGELLLPVYIEELRSHTKRKIRIWSAAASTGQEAYSTAMFIDHYLDRKGIKDVTLSDFEIVATDISTEVLEIARKGRYDSISIMRGLAGEYKEKYFTKVGLVWEIDEKIKRAVRFESFNLQSSFMFLGDFDLVFCRYVLIYFADDFKNEIFRKLSNSILKNGTLIIGASEIYYSMESLFTMKNNGNGTFYKRKVDEI